MFDFKGTYHLTLNKNSKLKFKFWNKVFCLGIIKHKVVINYIMGLNYITELSLLAKSLACSLSTVMVYFFLREVDTV
uniref:Uncharacterized protein n=1 Tax=Cannabis sativa TaxID=3483 RepID=A0A803QV27_CANSA